MKDEFCIVRCRWGIIAITILVTLFFGFQLTKISLDPDVTHYIPEHMESRINTKKIDSVFGGNQMMIVVFKTDNVINPKTLERVETLTDEFQYLDGVNRVISLFTAKDIQSDNGMIAVEPAIAEIPQTKQEAVVLAEKLKNNKSAMRVVVSDDFTMTSIILILDSDLNNNKILKSINKLLAENPGYETVFLGGLPYLSAIVSKSMTKDFLVLMPAGLVIMLLMLYLFFRQKRGVLLPFAVVVMSIIITMGMVPLFGWQLSLISVLLPIILIAVANDYGIHLVAYYQELIKNNTTKKPFKLSYYIFKDLKKPILFTGLTTIVGMLSLLSHKMIPARQLGVLAAIGIAVALLMSLFFIPAALSFMKKTESPKTVEKHHTDIINKFLTWLGNIVSNNPAKVLIFSISLTVIFGTGILFLKVDTNVVNFFPKHHIIREGTKLINEHFGGTQSISILVEGDLKNPDLLKRMDKYSKEIKQLNGVGSVMSLSDVVKILSKVLNDKTSDQYDKIPDTRDFVAQYLGLYTMNSEESDLDQLVDYDYRHARIIITLNNTSNIAIKNIVNKIKEITKNDPNIKTIGGRAYVNLEMAHLVVNGQMLSLLFAILVIGALVSIIFKSVSSGLISMIPLTMAVIFLFGIMGIFNVKLDIATAMLSSMMIGIGVDYTIHFLWRYKTERQNGLLPPQAVKTTMTTTGRGIIFNALSVIIGFSVLLISGFPPIRFFGMLILISIVACLGGAFLTIPGILILLKPKFTEPKNNK